MISRRCSERRFFLNPSGLVFAVFGFVLAIAAKRKGLAVHAVCVLGNHYHAIVTDPHGEIGEFCRYLHEFTAKCLNMERGRWENLWSITETSRVSLEDAEAILDKVGYTLCNPVSSWLVPRGEAWPGLRRWWADKPVKFRRPALFREAGPLPAEATLTLVPPEAFSGMDDDGVALVSAHLAEREQRLRDEAKKKSIRFLGVRRLSKQRWSDCPTSFARRMSLRPRVATRDNSRRIEALCRNKQFEIDHAEALKAWRAGKRDAVFPFGTYKMRRLHGVSCVPPPS